MYIEPNSVIRLLKNCPLDNRYDHTIYFISSAAQVSYFTGLAKHVISNSQYQRVNIGVFRCPLPADQVYDCNYMMFQNTAYGTKWFYAFITSVEYVNNSMCNVSFELDVIQSWFFDFTLGVSYVEREHSVTDGMNLESNQLPEPVELGEYYLEGYGELNSAFGVMCVILAIVDINSVSEGTLIDGIYSGCQLYAYRYDDVETINAKIASYAQSTDSIVSMYMCPALLLETVIPTGKGVKLEYSESGYHTELTGTALTGTEAFGQYTPKNKKLYTYPYNYLCVDNGCGQSLSLRYEYFTDGVPKLDIGGTICQPVQLICRPTHYKGSGSQTFNMESLTLTNYPQCSWNVDSFEAWFAQNSVPIAIGTGIAAAGGLAGMATAGSAAALGAAAKGMGGSVLNSVIPSVTEGYQASIQADICRGNTNNGNGNTSLGKQNFFFGRARITSQYCRMIDDFFTRFGYACKKLKVPNISSRPHFNYVKTLECVVTGSVPADSMRKIAEIHNNGITYWKNGSEVGNYELDNSPA